MVKKRIGSRWFLRSFVLFIVLLSIFNLPAQENAKPYWSTFQSEYQIKTSLGFQFWSTYTMNQEIFEPLSRSYSKVDNRWNTQLRRTRLSVSGIPYDGLSFKLTASLDLIGRDTNAATHGGNNNGNTGQFGVWNAWLRWQAISSSDLLHITAGFQPPQIGRESITGALNSTSFEKSWSQNYLRRTIVGRGPGRTMGINVGGQRGFSQLFSFSYDVGVFSPQAFSIIENSQGIMATPLFVGRLAFHIGDAELQSYSTSHKVNYFGKRQGLTLALAASHQGETDIFDRNQALGFDWLFNFNMLNLDGEWTYYKRSKNIEELDLTSFSNGGYIRLGYNLKLLNGKYIEPVVMFVKFNGPLGLEEQKDALLLKSFAGTDAITEIGFNYHVNPKLKITLTYTINKGEKGNGKDGVSFNNYYSNSNKDPIRRGDMIGLALVGIF